MVFGGEDDVFHAGILGRDGPTLGCEVLGIEGAVERLVGLLVFIEILALGAFDGTAVVVQLFARDPRLVADAPALHHAPLSIDAPVHHEAEF